VTDCHRDWLATVIAKGIKMMDNLNKKVNKELKRVKVWNLKQ